MPALPVAVTTRPPNVQLKVTGPPTYHAFTPIGVKPPDCSLTLILLDTPRHEYFRRLVCRLFGEEVENGELPGDIPWIAKVVSDICYYNAKQYFGFL